MGSITEVSPEEKTMLLSMEYQPSQPHWQLKLQKSLITIMIYLLGFTSGILYFLIKTT